MYTSRNESGKESRRVKIQSIVLTRNGTTKNINGPYSNYHKWWGNGTATTKHYWWLTIPRGNSSEPRGSGAIHNDNTLLSWPNFAPHLLEWSDRGGTTLHPNKVIRGGTYYHSFYPHISLHLGIPAHSSAHFWPILYAQICPLSVAFWGIHESSEIAHSVENKQKTYLISYILWKNWTINM